MRAGMWTVFAAATPAVFLAGSLGCNAVPELEQLLSVATTAADRIDAPADSGPIGLANSTWSLMRKADPNEQAALSNPMPAPGPYGGLLSGQALQRPPVGERIFLVRFGDHGQMVEVTENRFFLPEVYGMTVPIGGEWTGAALPGVFFNSASYGGQVGDRFGLAVLVHVRFGQTYLGKAVLYAWGTINGDMIGGQFGYVIDFTDGAVSFLGTVADQYPIEGRRVDG